MGLLADFQERWGLSMRRLVRPEGYRGEQTAMKFPGLKYDAASSAGLLLILGMLAQIRGLALETQKACVALLRRILLLADFPEGFKLLVARTLVRPALGHIWVRATIGGMLQDTPLHRV